MENGASRYVSVGPILLLQSVTMIRAIRHHAIWPLLVGVALLAACRGTQTTTDPQPIPPTADALAATPSPRPDATATLASAFPAPSEDGGRADGDPTLPTRTPTPAAGTTDDTRAPVCEGLTPSTAEGDAYLPNTPQRTILREAGMAGQPLLITGYVLDANCAPIEGAWLDFWQAGADGVYDTTSFRLRGHQFTDADGRFRLETIIPGATADRPPHLYAKVQPPNGPVLTTQLFFPDEPGNTGDAEFDPALLLTTAAGPDALTATFDFVVETE
jgi:protocatechuate 3,4-dioxygenase beta subunit